MTLFSSPVSRLKVASSSVLPTAPFVPSKHKSYAQLFSCRFFFFFCWHIWHCKKNGASLWVCICKRSPYFCRCVANANLYRDKNVIIKADMGAHATFCRLVKEWKSTKGARFLPPEKFHGRPILFRRVFISARNHAHERKKRMTARQIFSGRTGNARTDVLQLWRSYSEKKERKIENVPRYKNVFWFWMESFANDRRPVDHNHMNS